MKTLLLYAPIFYTPYIPFTYLIFIPKLSPCQFIWRINSIFSHPFLQPQGSKMCFGDPYKHTYIDRHADANATLHAPLLWFYTPPHHKVADLSRLCTKPGVKCVYFHALGLPHFPSSYPSIILLFSHLERSILYKIKLQTRIYS